jgi:hypothetical protein
MGGGGGGGGGLARSEHSPPAKFHSSSNGEEELFDEHGNPIPQSAEIMKGHASRRNSLQDMLDRAMAFVNLRPKQNNADDDLTPFGTRRDSLFSG